MKNYRLDLRTAVWMTLLLVTVPNCTQAGETVAAFTIDVDLGKDVGQSFGSLFEVRDAAGRVIAGAGFMDVYNTRFRSDRHTLQFFVRPQANTDRFTIDRLPHPDLDCGIYLFDVNAQLYAWSSVRNNSVRLWQASERQWVDAPPTKTGRIRSGDGVTRVGSGALVFSGNQAAYNGRTILTAPSIGRYYNFYYGQGRLFFYHTHRSDDDGFTKIYACPWTPDHAGPIDLSDAAVMQAKYVGETPFAYGQFQGSVLTVSNQGGVYVFEGTGWKTLNEANINVSNQVYSMLNYFDRLLLAQYPTGHLFEYRGKQLKHLKDWPPRLPGVSPSAREAQTMAIYRGELFVGVWPWAEVWRYNRDETQWHSLGRMFTHPAITDKTVHPYEAEAVKHRLIFNHWGQRVTGMVPLGSSLMLSTSSKGTHQWFDKYKFLTDRQRREYGAVIRLTMPGNLAAPMKWKNQPTKLEFVIAGDRLIIRQDGKELASSRFSLQDRERFQRSKVNWGKGVFGKLNGRITKKSRR